MARTAEKVRDLIEEDESMEEAIELVRRVAAENDGEVHWTDVNDDLSSGQWGRLIEKGVLRSGDGDAFHLTDESAVDAALSGEASGGGAPSTPDLSTDEESNWTQYDKLAGVLSLALMSGYYVDSVRKLVGGVLDVLLMPLANTMPFFAVVLCIATLTGLYSTLLQSNLTDMEKMAKYQERMQDIQERRKEAKERGDEDALDEIQEEQMEAMGDQMGMFKEQFRPMVWIFLLTIPFFLWIYHAINGPIGSQTIILPMQGEVTWTSKVLGPMQTWIVWYFLCSMGFVQVIRKSLNLQTTPGTS